MADSGHPPAELHERLLICRTIKLNAGAHGGHRRCCHAQMQKNAQNKPQIARLILCVHTTLQVYCNLFLTFCHAGPEGNGDLPVEHPAAPRHQLALDERRAHGHVQKEDAAVPPDHGGEKLSAPLPPVPIEAVVPVHSAPPPLHPAAGRLLVPLKMRFSLPFMGDSSFSSAAPAGRLGIRLCSGRIGQACSGYAGRGAARNGVLTVIVSREAARGAETGPAAPVTASSWA